MEEGDCAEATTKRCGKKARKKRSGSVRLKSLGVFKEVVGPEESRYNFSKAKLIKRRLNARGAKKPAQKSESVKRGVKFNSNTELDVHDFDDQLSELDDGECYHIQSDTNTVYLPIDVYVHQLKQEKAFIPCDGRLRAFCLRDFNSERLELKIKQYVIVYRRAKLFLDKWEWIYWCSCNDYHVSFSLTLDNVINTTYEDFTKISSVCLHMKVARQLISEYDSYFGITVESDFTDHNYSQITIDDVEIHVDEENTVRQIGNDDALCVFVPIGYGVAVLIESKITCMTCKYGKHTCPHVNAVNVLFASDDEEMSLLRVWKSTLRSQSEFTNLKKPAGPSKIEKSRRIIPYTPSPEFASVLKDTDRFCLFRNEDDNVCQLYPSSLDLICSECGFENEECTSSELILNTDLCYIVTPLQILKCIVYQQECANPICCSVLKVDGGTMGLLRVGQLFLCHTVLRRFMYSFFQGRNTMYTEHSVLAMMHSSLNNHEFNSILPYNAFRSSWYTFLSLLDINYEDGFRCSICDSSPKIVIMDATSLSFKKDMIKWSSFQDKNDEFPLPQQSKHSDRVFIDDNKTRKLLKAFAMEGIPEADYVDLLVCIKAHAMSLVPLFENWKKNNILFLNSMKRIICPKPWSQFLFSLAAKTPVCGLLHLSNELLSVLDNLNDAPRLPEALKTLQTRFPSLLKLIESEGKVDSYLSLIIIDLIKKSQQPFKSEQEVSCENLPQPTSNPLSYFPSFPTRCSRGRYKADTSKKSPLCSKKGQGHPSLLPGIFTIYCQHGICLGFEVMELHESPNTAFSIIVTCFKSAPDVIVYDNACNLHTYCLNRKPLFFKNTWCLVDRFHWRNHTGCSSGYNLSEYPQFKDLNSQVVEQANSALQRIKGSLSYMTANNFMNHCKLFLWHKNQLCNK